MYCDANSLTSLANAIRTAGGTSAQLQFPADFVNAIKNIGSSSGYQVETGTFPAGSDKPRTWSHNVTFVPEGVVIVRADVSGQYYGGICTASSVAENGTYGTTQSSGLSGPGGLLLTQIVLGSTSVSITNPQAREGSSTKDTFFRGTYLYMIWGK